MLFRSLDEQAPCAEREPLWDEWSNGIWSDLGGDLAIAAAPDVEMNVGLLHEPNADINPSDLRARIIAALSVAPTAVDDIARGSGVSVARTRALLLEMELHGDVGLDELGRISLRVS